MAVELGKAFASTVQKKGRVIHGLESAEVVRLIRIGGCSGLRVQVRRVLRAGAGGRSGLASGLQASCAPERTGEFASAGFPTHVVPAATAPTLNELPRELHPFRRTAQSARTTSTSSTSSVFFSWSPAPSTSSTPFKIVTDMPVAVGATSGAPR
jgi:hypothetical protein